MTTPCPPDSVSTGSALLLNESAGAGTGVCFACSLSSLASPPSVFSKEKKI
jgi:hypothetical protein